MKSLGLGRLFIVSEIYELAMEVLFRDIADFKMESFVIVERVHDSDPKFIEL
jgi:hypothetical protein